MNETALARIAVLAKIRVKTSALRAQLLMGGVTDYWHLNECDRLVAELMAEPLHKDYDVIVGSLGWHLQFQMAEYEVFKKGMGEIRDAG